MIKKRATRHDRRIKKDASSYVKKGYNVKADVKGYATPSIMNKRRADMVIKKDGKRTIIEYETKRSMVEDRGQRKDLRDYAKKYDNTQFKTVNVDRKKVPKKKKKPIK